MARGLNGQSKEKSRKIVSVALLRDVAILAAVYTYFGGWMFLEFYYRSFGLPPRVGDYSYQSVLTFGTNLVLQPYAIAFKVGLTLMVIVVLTSAMMLPWARAYIVCTGLILLFPAIETLAFKTAVGMRNFHVASRQFGRVRVDVRDESWKSKQLVTSLFQYSEAGNLYLLTENSTRYYLIGISGEPGVSEKLSLFDVAKSDISVLVIVPVVARMSE